ncbi:Druantia anti-phage system protein DruA [Bathymodiolus platifrons methanotrophic gill symbiont]|uniref:Druantia anti-phage system protein DruA n=1 Tax=Bathymodiolus platifrons methanotrophic gill symbiont TaxID=113268 RepID=UPI001E48A6BF
MALVLLPGKQHHVINLLDGATKAAKKPTVTREQCPFFDYALGEVQQSRFYVLSMIARHLPTQWEERYGIRPVLPETFVDTERFAGSCYKTTNLNLRNLSSG